MDRSRLRDESLFIAVQRSAYRLIDDPLSLVDVSTLVAYDGIGLGILPVAMS
jgi:hypothetical protein